MNSDLPYAEQVKLLKLTARQVQMLKLLVQTFADDSVDPLADLLRVTAAVAEADVAALTAWSQS